MMSLPEPVLEASGLIFAYEGGQHLVTPDLELARAIQRDPRMEAIYTRYLTGWRDRFGDTVGCLACVDVFNAAEGTEADLTLFWNGGV